MNQAARALCGGLVLLVAAVHGRQPAASPQDAVRVHHAGGQTFVTWPETGVPAVDRLTGADFKRLRSSIKDEQRLSYRIYRSGAPIDNVRRAELIAEVEPLSGWNAKIFGRDVKDDAVLFPFVIDPAAGTLPPGSGLYVYSVPMARSSYYAVATVSGGRELPLLTTTEAIVENPGDPVPVLQRTDRGVSHHYIDDATLQYYVRWEDEGALTRGATAQNYLVATPPGVKYPAPVGLHLHGWGGSLVSDHGWWFNAEKGAILVSSTLLLYDWWTGYHERLAQGRLTAQSVATGAVHPYTQRRLLSFIDWLATNIRIDKTRVFAAGNSMGGSGAIMLAIRHPERIAWAIGWVGVHSPKLSPTFRSSYEGVYGLPSWNARFEDGTPVWDYYDDTWYLRQHPERDIGLISFSNGKNDRGIGWEQAVQFYRALQDTRQPHVFVWGQHGHGERATMPAQGGERVNPLDLRTDQSLPAFTHGSLDDDPGNGAPEEGAPSGQSNLFLTWNTATIVDDAAHWSVTIALTARAPQPTATVDVTPRRLQRFTLAPGDKLVWTNSQGERVVQGGELVADRWGLATLPQVQITRHGSTITLRRQ